MELLLAYRRAIAPPNVLFGVLISVFVLVLPAMGVPAALFMLQQGYVSAIHIALFAVGFLVTGLGVTVGYHRLLTHRSFETHGILKILLLIFGSMAVQGSALEWAANHRLHHAHSDQPGATLRIHPVTGSCTRIGGGSSASRGMLHSEFRR